MVRQDRDLLVFLTVFFVVGVIWVTYTIYNLEVKVVEVPASTQDPIEKIFPKTNGGYLIGGEIMSEDDVLKIMVRTFKVVNSSPIIKERLIRETGVSLKPVMIKCEENYNDIDVDLMLWFYKYHRNMYNDVIRFVQKHQHDNGVIEGAYENFKDYRKKVDGR
jgi:hypothetical protein